ncbi:hypothetical protein FLX56_20230 [Synechococcus moorigangaii CMS01]|nr:hypothetical protein [Synechococcus moorigangaii CMS01]
MAYSFDLLGAIPLITFFNYQQQNEQDPQRPKAYLTVYRCTLDSFIDALEMIPKRPHWNWDEVVETIVHFWIKQEDVVRRCEQELPSHPEEPYLVVARIANLTALRRDFETLFEV